MPLHRVLNSLWTSHTNPLAHKGLYVVWNFIRIWNAPRMHSHKVWNMLVLDSLEPVQDCAQRKASFGIWIAQIKNTHRNTKTDVPPALWRKYPPNFRCVMQRQGMNREGGQEVIHVWENQTHLFIKLMFTFNRC